MGQIDRPTVGLPDVKSLPGGRPGIAEGKPGIGDRPVIGRPDIKLPGDRPVIGKPDIKLPGDRPVIGKPDIKLPGDRPVIGKPDIKSPGDRPVIGRPDIKLPGDRPVIGRPDVKLPGDRPAIGRPDVKLPGDRPVIGRPDIKLPGDRPVIGGVRPGDRPVIGGNQIGGGNWIGNDFHFNNINIHRPGWGIPGPSWQNQWSRRHIHHHHHVWYHGCWSSHWGGRWYMPVALGATFWGLNALSRSWGFGYHYGYVNPYLPAVAVVAPAFDYSQPIVINNYLPAAGQDAATPPAAPAESSDEQAGYALFDRGRDAFLRGEYEQALQLTEQAIQKVPQDPVMHEFAAQCLFALGRYQQAATVLNALLAVSPGMDWTTMISLYRSSDEYTAKLRALETHIKQNPQDVAAIFVLAYHYLICGHMDAAAQLLQRVVEAQPDDRVARWMLDALTAEAEPEAEADAAPPAAAAAAPAETVAVPATARAKPETAPPADAERVEAEPSTDLVGRWQAERDGNRFELAIDEQGEFTWKFLPQDQEPSTIAGQYGVTGNALVMDGGEQGTLVGRVASGGPDRFQFALAGSPPDDPGLTFQRVDGASSGP